MSRPALTTLFTPWGEALDPDDPLPGYPRPQLVREGWQSLNGRWDYAITDAAGRADAPLPEVFDGEIVVPFSPEAALSGVNRQLQPHETLHYRRAFTPAAGFRSRADDRVLLHFGAVDQSCTVWVNGVEVGGHDGGYLPFSFDVTDALREGANELRVRVTDPSDTGPLSRGKQKLRRGGIWYTAQSGIWQTVWLEAMPALSVERLVITPHQAAGAVEVTVHAAGTAASGSPSATPAHVVVRSEGAVVASGETVAGVPLRLPIADVRPWSPEHPFLYDLEVALGDDRVTSYFGMRSFGMGPGADGLPRLLLNGEPYFHAGVLDQGYWPDGLYTPPSDAAMVHDIVTMKRLGFTMLRKHIKVEPARWYYHADRLGMLVWQDMVNGGGQYKPLVITAPVLTALRLDDRRHGPFARTDAAGREHWRQEARDTVEHLRNVVSIAQWVPFNEGWGQFDAVAVTEELRALDPTRTIDHASGWHDQGVGDVTSLHVYFRKFRVPKRRRVAGRNVSRRALVVSEYGGYSQSLPGHSASSREFGYKRFDSSSKLADAFVRLHEEQFIPAVSLGLAATVYTQVSDVEDETNGLLSYDRKVEKFPEDVVRGVNERLRGIR